MATLLEKYAKARKQKSRGRFFVPGLVECEGGADCPNGGATSMYSDDTAFYTPEEAEAAGARPGYYCSACNPKYAKGRP